MNKEKLLTRFNQAWEDLQASHAGLAEAEMLAPGVTGDWSVKDILAHVAWWEQEALKHLPLILAGGRPPRYSVTYGGIDAFNAQMMERKRHLSLADVLKEQEETHRRLVEYLQGVPAEQFARESRFCRRLRLDTFGHYPLHAAAIRQWREGKRSDR